MWASLHGNPVPGDPESVRLIARTFTDVEQNADRIRIRLLSISESCGPSVWEGIAADAFQIECEDLLPDLQKLATSHSSAAQALRSYANELEHAQSLARQALSSADDAVIDESSANQSRDRAESERVAQQSKVDAARHQLRHLRGEIATAAAAGDVAQVTLLETRQNREQAKRDNATIGVTTAVSQRDAAQRRADEARRQLEAARSLADDARRIRENAGNRASRTLEDASEAGIQNKSMVQRTIDAAVDAIDKITASQLFKNFLDGISLIGDVLAVVGVVVAFVNPAVGAALFVLGAAFSAVAFAGTLLAFGLGNASWQDLTLSALGLTPFKKAQALLKLGGTVKRAFAYADNTKLAGIARKLMWERFTVAAKKTRPDELFFLSDSLVFRAATANTVLGPVVSLVVNLTNLDEKIFKKIFPETAPAPAN